MYISNINVYIKYKCIYLINVDIKYKCIYLIYVYIYILYNMYICI